MRSLLPLAMLLAACSSAPMPMADGGAPVEDGGDAVDAGTWEECPTFCQLSCATEGPPTVTGDGCDGCVAFCDEGPPPVEGWCLTSGPVQGFVRRDDMMTGCSGAIVLRRP